MDDSEVLINLNKSFQNGKEEDETIPLENENGLTDSARQTANSEFQEFVKDQLRGITHDFSNWQKEIIHAMNQIRQDVEDEVSAIKGRIMKIQDQVDENQKTLSWLTNQIQNRENKEINPESLGAQKNQSNVVTGILSQTSGVGQASPATCTNTNEHAENDKISDKQKQQNTDSNILLDKNMHSNINYNNVELDGLSVPGFGPNKCPSKGNVTMKPQLYEGDEDLNEYLAQFEILAEINGWDYETKSLYLAGSLKGGARALLNELDKESRKDYDSLVKVLNTRYGSAEKSELFRAKLQTRIRGKEETLPELAQSIKKLTRQAYPSAPSSLTSVLALEHFIDAIPDSDLRLRLRESNPKSINEAETLAVRLETLKLAERQKGRIVRQVDSKENEQTNKKEGSNKNEFKDEFSDLRKDILSLTKEIRVMTRNNQNNGQRGDNYRRNFNNGQRRPFNDQNRNFGQGNRNFNPRNGNFGQNRQNVQNFNQQGNLQRSNSGVGARPFQNGPSQ